jgi:hypothetical protein
MTRVFVDDVASSTAGGNGRHRAVTSTGTVESSSRRR